MSSNKDCLGYVQKWLNAVCSHNLNDVMSKYSQNGILIGTIAEKILIGKPAIRTYFVDFLRKPELCGEINSSYVQILSPRSFIVSGVYTFAYREGTMPEIVLARYSFVFGLENNTWKIINHHSSKIPNS
jgi:uncharacterized protein (TIGR02246 family)